MLEQARSNLWLKDKSGGLELSSYISPLTLRKEIRIKVEIGRPISTLEGIIYSKLNG